MKLMFFIPTLGQGGGERVVSELSQHFPKYIESVLVVFEKKLAYPYKGRVISLGTPVSANVFLRLIYFFIRLWRFRKVVKHEQPDKIVSFGGSAAAIALLLNTKPIVRVDMYLSVAKKGVWGLLSKLAIKLLYHRAKKIVTVSQDSAQDLIENFGVRAERIQVLYNPIDIEKIERLAQESAEHEAFNHPVIITVGRLTKQKGHEYLVRAFEKVQQKVPEAKLVVIGEGELRAPLENHKDIYVLGWQDNPYKFLARAHVFVLSSLWEGLPTVMLEAMACGVPIVSFDCASGPKEILTAGSGILVPVKDEHALAAEIVHVLQDKELARSLSAKAVRRAQDFDIKKIIKYWA